MYFYGPVPSRRLGYSLGVDLIPKKVCSFDCVYCHVARTTKKTDRQFSHVNLRQLAGELKTILRNSPRIDWITISGSGEPTLHKNLDKIIGIIKTVSGNKYPVCVITNSSLLARGAVRRQLRRADLIIPSLNAATQDVFEAINRPFKGIKVDKIINGLVRLRKEFKGKIWLEIMLVKGINDTIEEARRLGAAIGRIRPDKVQLNIPVRPAWVNIGLPDKARVRQIAETIGGNTEVVVSFHRKTKRHSGGSAVAAILEFLKRRPASREDFAAVGIGGADLDGCLKRLIAEGKVKEKMAHGKKYFVV